MIAGGLYYQGRRLAHQVGTELDVNLMSHEST